MIVLDTNVISEMMKTSPSVNVLRWIDQQDVSELFITTITIAEIVYRINALPEGSKRHALTTAFHSVSAEAFKYRILDFNENVAYCYGNIMSSRKKLGKPLGLLDGQIAAIARSNEAKVATRNIRDFHHCELELINPFE